MYLGPRRPSLTKMLAARTSVKRAIRHNLGLKAPRGYGWLTNPKRAAYNRAYYRKNKAWGSAGGILFLVVAGVVIWVVQALIATWYIWVPLLIVGVILYVVQHGKAVAAAAEADAARQAEEARLAVEARAAERRALEARFPAVHTGLVPVRALSDPDVRFVEMAMESGERCYLGRTAEGNFFEVVTRKRKAGDADGRYSGAYAAWVFDTVAERWSTSSAPPGAREIRSAIADLRDLDWLVADEGTADRGFLGPGAGRGA